MLFKCLLFSLLVASALCRLDIPPWAKMQNMDPGNYYASVDTSLTGQDFRRALHLLLSKGATAISYAEVWAAFLKTDEGWPACPSDTVRDIYSAKCWSPQTGQCGTYKKEGDCYNREHSWPKSWWNGTVIPSYTDLHHLFPSDGYVNGLRSDWPLGYVGNTVKYVSTSGAKLGSCRDFAGATCFEPSNDVKGELARAYFYIATRYLADFTCCDEAGVNKYEIKEWMENNLFEWHFNYPPTASEMKRNDVVHNVQGNRNPFVDYPNWVSKIGNF